MSDSTTKPCSKCEQEKPATLEYFVYEKNTKSHVGAQCRDCKNAGNKRYRDENPEKSKESSAKYRAKHPNQKRDYYLTNRERTLAVNRVYREAHREELREWQREFRRNNPEYHRERDRIYGENNRVKLSAKHKKWRHANPEKWRATMHNSRARRRNAKGRFTEDDIQLMYRSQCGRCWYCQCDLRDTGYDVEHRVPVSRGGTNETGNLVLSCPRCNHRKNKKLPHEWCGRLL